MAVSKISITPSDALSVTLSSVIKSSNIRAYRYGKVIIVSGWLQPKSNTNANDMLFHIPNISPITSSNGVLAEQNGGVYSLQAIYNTNSVGTNFSINGTLTANAYYNLCVTFMCN